MSDAINRLELVAKKMEMSIEDALSILEGKHPSIKTVSVVAPEPAVAPKPSGFRGALRGFSGRGEQEAINQNASAAASDTPLASDTTAGNA